MLDAGGAAGAVAGAAAGKAALDTIKQARSLSENVASFVSSARAGGFEVSEEGGNAMISAIEAFQQWATSQGRQVRFISEQPMLGSSNGARQMAPFAQNVATDGEGFATQFQALLESLEQAKEGIRTAMENYRRTDEANQAAVRQSGGSIAV